MTISTTDSTISYSGDGATTAFAVPFEFFDDGDLEVIIRTTSTGAETVKTLTSDYTVAGGGGAIGTVTMIAAPASGTGLFIRRVTALTQETDLQSFGPLPAEAIEDMGDKLTIIAQETKRDAVRTLLLPKTETSLTLPNSVERASKYLKFDANGNPTAAAEVIPGAVTISSFMEPLLNSANGPQFLAGVNTSQVLWCGTAGGTSNAIALTPSTALGAYAAGLIVAFKSGASDNTGPVTINVSGLGAKNFIAFDGSAFVYGDIAPNATVLAIYDGTQFRLISFAEQAPTFEQVTVGDIAFYLILESGLTPTLSVDYDDRMEYDRINNRWKFLVNNAVSPIYVGSGVLTDDTVSMAQGWNRLESYTVSGSPGQKDFNLSTYITRGYKRFRFNWRNVTPAAAAVMRALFSVDAGASWKSAGGDYGNSWRRENAAGGTNGGTGIGYVQLSGTTNVQTAASHAAGASGWLEIESDRAGVIIASYENRWLSATPALEILQGASNTTFAGPVNAVRLQFVGQNFENNGSIHVYGSAA